MPTPVLMSTINGVANAALPAAGGTVTGDLTVSGKSTHTGDVGIGKAPLTQLDVSGSVNATGTMTAASFSGTSTTLTGNAQAANLTVTGTSTQTGHVGVGKAPHATYSLDVSGSVNATSIVVGGSTAKQIDCGSFTCNGTSQTISFNFTFANIPVVIIQEATSTSAHVFSPAVTNRTTTNFTCKITYWYNSTTYGFASGDTIYYIAIG